MLCMYACLARSCVVYPFVWLFVLLFASEFCLYCGLLCVVVFCVVV